MKKSMAAMCGWILTASMFFSPNVFAAPEMTTAATYGVQYKTHVQDYGWETDWKTDGELSGTIGKSKRLEALRVELTGDNLPVNANIQTYVHVQNVGDLGPFDMGKLAGTEGKGLRLERITLTLNNLPDYQLRYNVQVQNIGWLRDENDVSTWFVGGESAGTNGKGYRLEGIKIVLVETNEAYDAYKKAIAAVQEENYTSLSWIYYQANVEANAVTAEDNKETIIEATKAIIDAQKSLVKASDLTAFNHAITSVNEVDYTPESWAIYQEVVGSNYVTKDDSQAVITAATKTIVEAQKALQRKINLTKYYEVLAAAIESDYLPESWAEYQQVLAANVVTEADTQTAINAAVKNIEEAQKKMVRRLDFTGYKSLLNAVKEADYTTETWSAYQDVVNANAMTEDNTQSEIEKAMGNIAAAQKNLIKAADLSAYDVALSAVTETDYTPASWLIYQKVVKANKVTAANGQTAIDAATQKILAAQLNLVTKGDFTDYEKALAAVNQNDYTPVSWMAYQKVVTGSKVNAASTQDAIDKATDKILTAQLSLVRKGDLTNYKNALVAVKQVNYTAASWTEYQKVVKANVMTSNNPQSEVDLATEKIIAAQENLEFKGGDLRAYETALAKVKQTDYTIASWKIYQKVVDANVVDGENKQNEIDDATKAIQTAQSALIKKGDLTSYNIALAGLQASDYTAATWTAYQNVLKVNVRTTEDSQAIIDLSTEKILAAQKSLVKVGGLTEYNEALAAVRQENYTPVSWTAYQLVVKANVRTQNDAQLVIDASVKNILNAQKNLVRKYDMSAYNALLAAVKQANYTPASWTAYQLVVKAYPASYSPIQTAIEKIEAAQVNLVKVVDLTAYKNALAAVKQAEYIPETWTAYQVVVNANVMTTANTQAQIETAVKNILEAQKSLKKKVNLTEYLDLLEGAVAYDYSPTSWAAYQKILSNNVMNENNTQTEVDAAVKAIRTAQNNVLVRRLDYTKYKELLAKTDGKQDLYTSVSWGIYQKVVGENTLTMDKEIDTQTAIDKAVVNIEAAQKKLVKAGDLTAYNLVLNAAKIEDYTSATWAVYLKVLEANEMTKNHSQAEIDAATEKIRLAQLKLAKAGIIPDEYKRLVSLDSTLYLSASWSTYQKVLDANYVTGVDGQTKINTALAKISEASRKLVLRAKMDKYNDVIKYNLARAADKTIPMNPLDYSGASWTIYQKVLDTNDKTNDNTQAVIDKAAEVIFAAQKKLVLRAPQALYDKYKALVDTNQNNRDKYTDKTWETYKKIADANIMYPENSTTEIEAAIRKIEAAQVNLLPLGDLTFYTPVFTDHDGEEYMYTSASWKIYEAALKTYTMTNQSKQGDIDFAIEKIKAAAKKLVNAPLTALQAYYDAIAEYDGRRAEFTEESWLIYQKAIETNPVNKDMTAAQVQKATTAILTAQGKLASQANFDQFKEQLSLYQENRIDADKLPGSKGKYADRVASGWGTYSDVVERYASFDDTWNWKSTGAKPEDITPASPQKDVDAVTAALKAAKDGFVFITEYKDAYAQYDLAMTYPVGKNELDFTTDSVTVFKLQQKVNAIPERVKAELSEIIMKLKNMQQAQLDLVPRASVATVNQFNAEVTKYNVHKEQHMKAISADYQYIWENCDYTQASWEPYEKMITDYQKVLKPENNTDADYNKAITAIKAKEKTLRYRAEYVLEVVIYNYLSADRVIETADLMTLANDALVAEFIAGQSIDAFYDIALVSVGSNVGPTGTVTGTAGNTAEVLLKVTDKGSPLINLQQSTLTFTIK